MGTSTWAPTDYLLDPQGAGGPEGRRGQHHFLHRLLTAIGLGGTASLEAGAKAGQRVDFDFDEVEVRGVLPGLILEALEGVDPAKFGLKDLQANKIHIAYEYLYARKVNIQIGGNYKAGFEFGADPAEVAKFKAKLGANAAAGENMVYNGAKGVVAIAFRVGQLGHDEGKYTFNYEVGKGFGNAPWLGERERYICETGTVFDISEG